MAYLDWFNRQDLFGRAPGAPGAPAGMAGAPAASGGAPAGAPPPAAATQAPGTGFVNLDRVFGLNAAGGAQLANNVAGAVTGAAQTATTQQQADTAAQQARLAGSQGGRPTLLGSMYGQAHPYTAGERNLDGYLAGAAGGPQLQAVASQFGGLDRTFGLPPPAAPVAGYDKSNDFNPLGGKGERRLRHRPELDLSRSQRRPQQGDPRAGTAGRQRDDYY